MIPGAPLILRGQEMGRPSNRSLIRGSHQIRTESGRGGGLEAKLSQAKPSRFNSEMLWRATHTTFGHLEVLESM